MRIPKRPPATFQDNGLLDLIRGASAEAVPSEEVRRLISKANREYVHWDEFRYWPVPKGISQEELWGIIGFSRRANRAELPLKDKHGKAFSYWLPDFVQRSISQIDQNAAGSILVDENAIGPESRDRYIISSLMDEAIASSQIEGASTTREIARDMLKQGRPARTRDEQMILNNYRMIQHIREIADQPLTPERILEIHRIVTRETLDDPVKAGALRSGEDRVIIEDIASGEVLHDPPPAEELAGRLEALCEFANAEEPWIHPVIRAIVLHFQLAYDHPFVDGNGRTARALFYWLVLRKKFWLFEYLTISSIINKAPVQYGRAFLYVETDGGDLTYFILYHLGVIERAVGALRQYLRAKQDQQRSMMAGMRKMGILNPRQAALLSHALRHPDAVYTIASHQRSHGVVYQTARTDLLEMTEKNWLRKSKQGKRYVFRPDPMLNKRFQI